VTALAAPLPAVAVPPLVRRNDAVVSGVAGGLADHLGWRVGPTRAVFVLLTVAFGAGVLLYAWLWAFTPVARPAERVRREAPVAWIALGLAMVLTLPLLGTASRLLEAGFSVYSARFTLVAATALTAFAGLWSAWIDRHDPLRGTRHDVVVRTVATILLASQLLATVTMVEHAPRTTLLLAPAIVVAIAAVWASTFVARMRELQAARVASIRAEHRAEMAAHLHDSVLQTLALIQNRAGASSEAGRLARAQERELRAWLYDGDLPADSDLATDLRDYGSALELDYEVVMTVVSAGASTERASGEVAAAAREAMLNAARHAGGEVSVYIEGSDGAVDVYVRDRGPGFSLDDVPPGRLGVRESILGRMRRIGGSATVGPGAGDAGTQVHIRYPAGGGRA
jgi:signal transduction histidine kinase